MTTDDYENHQQSGFAAAMPAPIAFWIFSFPFAFLRRRLLGAARQMGFLAALVQFFGAFLFGGHPLVAF
jgi:hypothetical protein